MNTYIESLIIAVTFATEAFTVFIYADYLYTEKCSPLKRNMIFITGHILLFVVYVSLRSVLMNTAMYFIVVLAIFITVYYCKLGAALFNSAVLTAFMILSEVASSAILSFSSGNIASYTENLMSLLSLYVLSKLLYLIFSITGSRIFEPNKTEENIGRYPLKLIIMPIASACTAITIYYIYLHIDTSYPLQIAGSVCMCALLFANIYTVSVYNRSEKVNRENLSLKLAMQKDEYDAEYYKMLDEQYERQRILVHDVKNHMQAINGLATEGKAEEIQRYIENWGCDKALQKQVR